VIEADIYLDSVVAEDAFRPGNLPARQDVKYSGDAGISLDDLGIDAPESIPFFYNHLIRADTKEINLSHLEHWLVMDPMSVHPQSTLQLAGLSFLVEIDGADGILLSHKEFSLSGAGSTMYEAIQDLLGVAAEMFVVYCLETPLDELDAGGQAFRNALFQLRPFLTEA